jgi:hypothetical protein
MVIGTSYIRAYLYWLSLTRRLISRQCQKKAAPLGGTRMYRRHNITRSPWVFNQFVACVSYDTFAGYFLLSGIPFMNAIAQRALAREDAHVQIVPG